MTLQTDIIQRTQTISTLYAEAMRLNDLVVDEATDAIADAAYNVYWQAAADLAELIAAEAGIDRKTANRMVYNHLDELAQRMTRKEA